MSELFEEIAIIGQRPVEELISEALFKQVEIISLKVLDSGIANNKTLS